MRRHLEFDRHFVFQPQDFVKYLLLNTSEVSMQEIIIAAFKTRSWRSYDQEFAISPHSASVLISLSITTTNNI